MGKKNENEMEQIQRGLEAFLERELDVIGAPGEKRPGKSRQQERTRQNRRYHDGQYEDAPYPDEVYPEESYGDEREYGARGYGQEDEIQIIGQREESRQRRRQRWDEGSYERGGQYEDEEPYQRRGQYRNEEAYGRGGQYDEEEPYRRGERYDEEEAYRGSGRYEYEEPYQEDGQDWDEEPVRRSRQYREGSVRRGRQYEDEEPPRRRRQISDEELYRQGRQYREESSRGRRLTQEETEDEELPKRKQRSRKADRAQWEEEAGMPKKSRKAQKKREKQHKKKHKLLKFLITAAVIFALLGVGLYQLVGVVYAKMTYSAIDSVTELPMKEDDVVNILLIGNDSRENSEDGRSDAMILLSISNRTKTIYMTSFLRDMYVEIPGYEGNRLNAAYSFGGAELLMDTIELNFDITINRYMLVNFEAFANLVDAVGGIELELTSEEIEYVNGYLVEYNMLTGREQGTDNMDTSVSGLVHLNGPQALAYSRNRYLGTDFGRTERQRKVLTAIIKKAPSAMLTNTKEMMDGLLPNLTTNLTQGECFMLSLMAGKLVTYDIVSDSIPQPGTYRDVTIRKMAVLEVDFEANIDYLKEKIYGE